MKPVVVRLLARAFDVVIPGAGLVLAGRPVAGAFAMATWGAGVLAAAAAICLGLTDPLRVVLVLAVFHAGLVALCALTRLGGADVAPHPIRALVGVGLLALALGLAVRTAPVRLLVVPDFANFPGLVPGEILVVRASDFTLDPPELGDLVVAVLPDGPLLARVAGLPGDGVATAGPSLTVGDAVVASAELGEVRVDDADAPPEESRSLRAWEEDLGGRRHLFFFRRDVSLAPTRDVVPEGRVFLLADNRSTARATDSREVGPVATTALIGRPVQVLWSPRPGGGVRGDRSGARWE